MNFVLPGIFLPNLPKILQDRKQRHAGPLQVEGALR